MTMPKKKNPVIAAVLGFFAPFGYLYIGWKYAIAASIIWVVFAVTLAFLDATTPRWMKYLLGIVFAWKGYTIVEVRNRLIGEKNEEARHLLDSFQFAYMVMTDLLVGIAMFYAGAITLYAGALRILEGNIIKGLLTLVTGTPVAIWLASLVFGFIVMLMDSLFALIVGTRVHFRKGNVFRK